MLSHKFKNFLLSKLLAMTFLAIFQEGEIPAKTVSECS